MDKFYRTVKSIYLFYVSPAYSTLCPECQYEVDRDVASAQELCNRGREKHSTQGLWGKEIDCQVGLSGAFCLDKWRKSDSSDRAVTSLLRSGEAHAII